jgi:hypothetical protein
MEVTMTVVDELKLRLKDALSAIESLSEDALGYGQDYDSSGELYRWPFRDELADNIRRALDRAEKGEHGHD